MLRLDKYIAGLGLASRRNIGKFVQSGLIEIDRQPVTKSDMKVSYGQILTFGGIDIEIKEFVYLILNKPSGYVCSEIDEGGHLSYKNLLQDCPYASMLHVAGRLDQDTEGLVLCSNDGQFTHNIISPKKHLEKEYFLKTELPLTDFDIEQLEQGVTLDDGYKTLPAKAYRGDNAQELTLIITEGKFHQVKRMLEAVNNKVVYLRRDRIGPRHVGELALGKWKYIDNG